MKCPVLGHFQRFEIIQALCGFLYIVFISFIKHNILWQESIFSLYSVSFPDLLGTIWEHSCSYRYYPQISLDGLIE